ncbi:hypothetical protein D1BOALGB6SA_5705 [Olavius sp. associated proteobacterium Delta 1]|nr:hypothetical protein D1BOALGB6SA_5705 [Olavius sp. associated proteobacterium Delta 1]
MIGYLSIVKVDSSKHEIYERRIYVYTVCKVFIAVGLLFLRFLSILIPE